MFYANENLKEWEDLLQKETENKDALGRIWDDLKRCGMDSSYPSSSCRTAAAAARGLMAAVRRRSPRASPASSAAATSRGSASGAPVRLETAPVVFPSWN